MSLKDDVMVYGAVILIVVAIFAGGATGLSYLFTRDPLAWIHISNANGSCGEGIHVTHNGQSIANLAIKRIDSGTWGATNNTGYLILSICSSVGAIVTFQATDYGFELEPKQIVEAAI